jgi:hypothetical protein
MRTHIVRRRPRKLGPVLSNQTDRSPEPQQQIVLQLMEQYDQYQLFWHHALRLNPPDWQMLEEISFTLTSLTEALAHFGVLR